MSSFAKKTAPHGYRKVYPEDLHLHPPILRRFSIKVSLHFCILAERKNKHHDHQDDQWQCQLLVDKEQEDKSADDFYQGDKKILRSVVCKLSEISKRSLTSLLII